MKKLLLCLLAMILSCEHALEQALDFDDVAFLEDTFTEAEQLYRTGSVNLDLAIEKFRFVVEQDSLNCFEDAYFYLANIYLTQNNPEQAREILVQGKELYSQLGEEDCISDITRRFDEYLERMSPDPLLGRDSMVFVAFDEPPTPIGGFAAIQRSLEYPQAAISKGIEGSVIIQVLIDCLGHACQTRVVRGGQLPFMDIAARKAVKSVMWKPAIQRNKPIRLWVTVPVTFGLAI